MFLVCSISENQKLVGGVPKMQEAWHRRHAVQIVAALPEEPGDALMVLELAKQLVENFLVDQPALSAFDRDGDRVRGAIVSLSSATRGASR
jgi:hypothetical protein